LCPEILVEITEYLSLNDAINALSINILQLIRQTDIRVHLVNPSIRFLQMIRQHLNPRQVTSIRLPGSLMESTKDFTSLHVFNELISLSLVNPGPPLSIGPLLAKFPTVHAVSLWYDNTFRYEIFTVIPSSTFNQITRLEIHCAGTICDHSPFQTEIDRYQRNHSIDDTFRWLPIDIVLLEIDSVS